MSKLTLGYWKIRGLGQIPRHLLAYTNTDFQQVQYENPDKWFKEDKINLGFDFPNLPYLIDGQFKLTESDAINVYIVKRSGHADLFGKTQQDQGTVNTIKGLFNDILKEIRALFASQDVQKEKPAALAKMAPKLDYLRAFVGNKDFALGYVTLADFYLAQNLYYFQCFFPEEKRNYAFWWRIRTNLENLPGVRSYYSRPDALVLPFLPPHLPIKPQLHKVKLSYWKIRGTAQTPRLLLSYLGVTFQDCYYQDQSKWFDVDRHTLGLDFPNLPYLIDQDLNVTEPTAIQRYIVNKWGKGKLTGHNPKDTAQIDVILSVFSDVSQAVKLLFFHKDWQNAKTQVLERIQPKLDQLNQYVGHNKFAVGYLTLADFVIAEESYYIERIFPREYKSWPFLNNIRLNFEGLKEIKDYYEKGGLRGPFLPEESPVTIQQQ